MINYADEHGRLPPAVVYGKDGRPLYSWRVLVLPYMEQEYLYKQFHLDEPWDSPHNIQLLECMPMSYAPPPGKRSRIPAYHTVCHVFVGKGTPFEEGQEVKPGLEGFPDATPTILILEAGPPVPWTKPEDLPYDPDGPLPPLDRLFHDQVRVGLADGSVWRFRKENIGGATFRAAITRNGGEPMDGDW